MGFHRLDREPQLRFGTASDASDIENKVDKYVNDMLDEVKPLRN